MVKVAILFAGQPRFITKQVIESVKTKVMDKYDCDVFCHFWWNPEGGTYKTSPWTGLGDLQIEYEVDKKIAETYQPKKMIWEVSPNPETFTRTYSNYYDKSCNYNIPCLYYSMMRVYQLMEEYITENDVVYDWVIKMRYDDVITNMVDLETLGDHDLYCPGWHSSVPGGNILIMKPLAAKIAMNIYPCMDEVYEMTQYLLEESMMTKYLQMNSVKYTQIDRNIFFTISARSY